MFAFAQSNNGDDSLIISILLCRKKKCFVRPGWRISLGNSLKSLLSRFSESRFVIVGKKSADVMEFDRREIDSKVFDRRTNAVRSIECNWEFSIDNFLSGDDNDRKSSAVIVFKALLERTIDCSWVQFSNDGGNFAECKSVFSSWRYVSCGKESAGMVRRGFFERLNVFNRVSSLIVCTSSARREGLFSSTETNNEREGSIYLIEASTNYSSETMSRSRKRNGCFSMKRDSLNHNVSQEWVFADHNDILDRPHVHQSRSRRKDRWSSSTRTRKLFDRTNDRLLVTQQDCRHCMVNNLEEARNWSQARFLFDSGFREKKSSDRERRKTTKHRVNEIRKRQSNNPTI